MKKLLLSVAAATACFFSVNAQHMTLHELFTGENCPPCAAYNPPFWALCDGTANLTKITHITFMTPIPSAGVFYNSQMTMGAARRSYYGVSSAPHGRYDGNATGTGNPASFNQGHIDTRYAVSTPFNITATHHISNDTVYGVVKIKAIAATSSTTFKLRTAYTKTMHFTTAPGTNGEKDFPNVVRAMFTNTMVATPTTATTTNGQAMKANWAVGDSVIYTYKGKISGLETGLSTKPFTKIDSNFFAFVQNDTSAGTNSKMVYGVAKSTYQVPVVVPPAAINNVSSSISDINIFPNPASSFVNVNCNFSTPSAAKVTITNVIGQVVAEKQFAAGSTQFAENIALGSVANGLYQVSLTANGETITKQFVVSK